MILTIYLFQMSLKMCKCDPNDIKTTSAVFPISAKKCEIFSSILALKFCEFRRFFSRQKMAFLFPAKNRRQLQFTAPRSSMSHEAHRKLAELRRRTFFFEEQPKIRKKNASVSVITFFFLGDHIKTGQNNEKIFQHRSKTPQELRHFQIEFKTFALFLAFLQ